MEKVKGSGNDPKELEQLTEEEIKVLHTIRARQMLRTEDTLNLDNFRKDVIDGLMPSIEQGSLGLVKPSVADGDQEPQMTDLFDLVKPGDKNKMPAQIEAF